MKLKNILVENFRCIEKLSFDIKKINDSYTYSLIGVNEAGKSSFLQAVSLIDEGEINYVKDFLDESKPVEVCLNYVFEENDLKELKDDLLEKGFPEEILKDIEIEDLCIKVIFDPVADTKRRNEETVKLKKSIFSDYTLQESAPILKTTDQVFEDFDLEKYFKEKMPDYFWSNSPEISFWKSDGKYLINNSINLESFITNPIEVSIPLFNCFNLAGFKDSEIKNEIDKIRQNSAEISNLQGRLGDAVTSHIKSIWPNHPITIKFQINNMQLDFLIEDEGVKYKAKTTSQRSDGFKQFISFLLSISAENTTEQLTNSLLLIDEPETHLHPQAQEYLREELIKISKNNHNNIVIFATHSNYMIDKYYMERCFRVVKDSTGKTEIEDIKAKDTSYSEVNYEVFGIPTSDYHNELYGYLEDLHPIILNRLPEDMIWHNEKNNKNEKVSLAKYIRHSIHHPENNSNKKFTPNELLTSIEILRKLKYGKNK